MGAIGHNLKSDWVQDRTGRVGDVAFEKTKGSLCMVEFKRLKISRQSCFG